MAVQQGSMHLLRCVPANLTFFPGVSKDADWCFAKSVLGTWTVAFNLAASEILKNSSAVLSVGLAEYSRRSSDVDRKSVV